MLEFNVKGLAELNAALEKVPEKLAANVVRGGIAAAARLQRKAVADEIRQQGLVRTGELAKSLKSSSRLLYGKPVGYVRTGVWYAHFLEGGTKPHKMPFMGQGSVQHPGIKEHRFMKRAFDRTAVAAVKAARDWMYTKMRDTGYSVPQTFSDAEESEA